MINVEEHLNLARKIAWDYCRYFRDKYSYDEIESTAYVGLIKAANRFDESKEVKFSTYAGLVISNEIKRMARDDKWYFVKRGVSQKILSLNFVIDSENNIEMQDILMDEEDIEKNIVESLVIKNLLELLDRREREIIRLYFYKNMKQSEIAKIINLSQPHVARVIKNSLNKMRKELYKDKFLA